MQVLRTIRISIKASIMMVVLFGGAISLGSFALFEVFGLAENAGTLQSDVDGLRQVDDGDPVLLPHGAIACPHVLTPSSRAPDR